MIYQALGNLAAALSYQEKAIDIMEQIFDKKHPSLADSYHNLSTMLIDKEDFEQALVYNKKALAIWQYNFPNGHPHIDIALQFHIYIKEQLGML